MGANLERLRQDVRNTASTIDSAIVLIAGIANRLREALMGEDVEGEVSGLADELEAAQAKLASAVAANTASEDDSNDVEPDHGPIDDSQTAPAGGEPTVDSSQEGGHDPSPEPPSDSGTDGQDAEPTSVSDNETGAGDSQQFGESTSTETPTE